MMQRYPIAYNVVLGLSLEKGLCEKFPRGMAPWRKKGLLKARHVMRDNVGQGYLGEWSPIFFPKSLA